MTDGIVNIVVFLLGLALVASGVAWRDPAASLVVVGGVLMGVVVVSRFQTKGRKQ